MIRPEAKAVEYEMSLYIMKMSSKWNYLINTYNNRHNLDSYRKVVTMEIVKINQNIKEVMQQYELEKSTLWVPPEEVTIILLFWSSAAVYLLLVIIPKSSKI